MYLCLDRKKYKSDEDLIREIIINMPSPFKITDICQITDQCQVTNQKTILDLLSSLCDSGVLIYIDGIFYHPKNQI